MKYQFTYTKQGSEVAVEMTRLQGGKPIGYFTIDQQHMERQAWGGFTNSKNQHDLVFHKRGYFEEWAARLANNLGASN